ncbi:MAG: CTP synthase, partial [Candidatus Omnitrophica bacterium]|nr:CTP synthase [Candidatus Omnitrophota bacterium]
NVLGLKGANSTEFNKETPHPVISMLAEQKKVKGLGGTMRLGAQACQIQRGTFASKAYHELRVMERHRHRYEFNAQYQKQFETHGAVIAGYLPGRRLVEILELKNHPWFVGVQFHPELRSKPDRCHPLFREFVRAALHCAEKRQEQITPENIIGSAGAP